MKKVLIGIATRGNDIYYKLCGWLLNQKESRLDCIDVLFARCHTGAAFAQNLIFKKTVEYDYDYLFMIDSDICPPDDIIDRLIEHDKDIIKAPVWHYDPASLEIHLDVTKQGDIIRRHMCATVGVERILTSSFSCLLVKKCVLRRFVETGEDFTIWSPLIKDFYKDLQSDTIFYAKTKALGFETWVDWGIRDIVHHRIVELGSPTLDKYMVNRLAETEALCG